MKVLLIMTSLWPFSNAFSDCCLLRYLSFFPWDNKVLSGHSERRLTTFLRSFSGRWRYITKAIVTFVGGDETSLAVFDRKFGRKTLFKFPTWKWIKFRTDFSEKEKEEPTCEGVGRGGGRARRSRSSCQAGQRRRGQVGRPVGVGQGVSWRKRWQPTSGGHEIESLQMDMTTNLKRLTLSLTDTLTVASYVSKPWLLVKGELWALAALTEHQIHL